MEQLSTPILATCPRRPLNTRDTYAEALSSTTVHGRDRHRIRGRLGPRPSAAGPGRRPAGQARQTGADELQQHLRVDLPGGALPHQTRPRADALRAEHIDPPVAGALPRHHRPPPRRDHAQPVEFADPDDLALFRALDGRRVLIEQH
ncbi:hypothetical protein ACWGLG_45305 [Streptomyces antimycoticus]